jgi:1-acyl-sn-glycerol-3-phosphate acyltransferase
MIPLPLWLRLPLATALMLGSTVAHITVLLAATLGKALAGATRRALWSDRLARIAECWIAVNSGLIDRFTPTRIVAELPEGLRRDGSYLVLANHQSWVDIPVLQYVFNRRIPLLRFFLKQELIWVPLLGAAWWALDFPFMQRYTREQIERRPELAGKDIDATRRACAKFRQIPVAVMNFVEGTRYTEAKHAQRPSPYRHLLRPKAGGIAFVLDAMGGALQGILDVTLYYPDGRPSLLDLLCGRIGRIEVQVQARDIPSDAVGSDYEADAAFRERFQEWVNGLWAEKDARLARMRGTAGD